MNAKLEEFDLWPAVADFKQEGEAPDQALIRLHQERYESREAADGLRHFSRSWLVFRAGGTRCLVASMRKQPRFWVFAAANFGIGIAFVLSTFNALDLLVSN